MPPYVWSLHRIDRLTNKQPGINKLNNSYSYYISNADTNKKPSQKTIRGWGHLRAISWVKKRPPKRAVFKSKLIIIKNYDFERRRIIRPAMQAVPISTIK